MGQGMTSEEVRTSEDGDFLRECTECTGKRVTKFFTYKLSQLWYRQFIRLLRSYRPHTGPINNHGLSKDSDGSNHCILLYALTAGINQKFAWKPDWNMHLHGQCFQSRGDLHQWLHTSFWTFTWSTCHAFASWNWKSKSQSSLYLPLRSKS